MMARANLQSAAMALPFLLLGLGAVAADKQLPSADMADGVTRRFLGTTSDAGCGTEQIACVDDTSCMTCLAAFTDVSNECQLDSSTCDEGASDDCQTDSDWTCDEVQDAYCCALAGEDENCEGNTLLSDYIECAWRSAVDFIGRCEYDDVDLSECNGVTGRSFSSGVFMGLCLTTTTGLLVSTIGFVV